MIGLQLERAAKPAGEFSIKKAGKEPCTVKEGEFYTCGKDKTNAVAHFIVALNVCMLAN